MRDLQYLFDKYKQNTNPTLIQQEASNPMYSVWLTASAGTGKTKVLIDRILRILLSGSDVSSILAITFTNAAAFEMKDRVMTTLQEWVFKEDKEIKTELINLYGKEFENKTVDEKRQLISLARSLFTKVLDSPYGLRIETIHAFCKFILKKFPVEAGINPNCSIIASSHDINTILDKIVRSIVINRDDKISDLLDVLLRYQSSGDLFKIIEAIKSEKSESIQKFIKLFSKYNIDFDNFDTKLRPIFVEKYKIDKSIILTDNYSNLVDEYIKFEKNKLVKSFDDLYNLSLEISRKSADHRYEKIVGKTPIERAQKVISFIQKYKETSDFDINDYLSFCNGRGKFNTKGLIEDIPDAERILNLLYNNKDIISNSITQLKYLEFGYAVTKFAYILIQKYSEEKQRQLVLDYDDLLTKTLQLLTKSPGYSEWVLYKLDNGINHILLDEAQDTTPEQWEIIDALSDGFFYSGVTKNNIKTIFVVGDYKQSIYSFQGANIDNFDYYHNKFERKIREHGFIFKNLNLDTSFRSSSPVLSFVNAMLLNKDISSGIISKHDTEDSYIHKVANFDTPGVVELWPVIAEETKKEDYDYWEPKQVIFESTLAKSKLAKLIADKIETLMQSGVRLGDILILVGTRTDASILLHLIKKLIDAKIDIAGVDKIILKDNIIICDLIALAQVCISEYDDLNVAALLKSPFFGFDEERVFDVCYNRGDKTVIQILSEKYPDLYKEFKAIQDMALSGITPFEFFTYILNRNGNWKKCYARAGMETEEIIKEFLSICLSFEQFPDHYLGLPGFIAWISKDDTKIKRTVDKDKDKLRIMTIHGAKGLQAKVVFIPDTMGNFVTQFPEILFNDDNKDDLIPYIKPSGVPDTSVYIQIRDNYKRRQIEEKKRLLYVAITRAKEAVYICGYGNKRLSDQKLLDLNNINNFYDIALNTFSKLSDYNLEKVMDKMFDGIECVGSKEIIRLPKYVDDRLISKSIIYENNTDQVDFDKTIVPFIKDINENCKLKEHKSDIYSVDTVHDNIGTLYGTLFHKLLEIIPVNYSVSDEVNLRVILTSYMQNIDFLNKEQKQNLINKLVSALNTETVRNIVLNPNSLNEVNISGEDGNTYRLDKLIIDYENKHILIVDYKTNTDAKDTSQEYIDKYKNQLSKYKMIIQNIYPSYSINTGILWLSDFSISMFDL